MDYMKMIEVSGDAASKPERLLPRTLLKDGSLALISFNQLREYLSLLVENGLIEYEEGNHTYRTTEKGIRFLQLQNKTDEALHQLNLLWQRDIVLL